MLRRTPLWYACGGYRTPVSPSRKQHIVSPATGLLRSPSRLWYDAHGRSPVESQTTVRRTEKCSQCRCVRTRNRHACHAASWPRSALASPSTTGPVARPCTARVVVDRRLLRRFRGHLPYTPRTRHLGLAELSSTRSYVWSCRFFSVLRTVSGQIDATTSNATNASASSCNDHRPYPAGGLPHRIAINLASAMPSSLWGVGAVDRFLRSSATSKPSVTNRLRTVSTVCTRQSYASAIFISDHSGPSASALRSICARLTFSDVPLSRLTIS